MSHKKTSIVLADDYCYSFMKHAVNEGLVGLYSPYDYWHTLTAYKKTIKKAKKKYSVLQLIVLYDEIFIHDSFPFLITDNIDSYGGFKFIPREINVLPSLPDLKEIGKDRHLGEDSLTYINFFRQDIADSVFKFAANFLLSQHMTDRESFKVGFKFPEIALKDIILIYLNAVSENIEELWDNSAEQLYAYFDKNCIYPGGKYGDFLGFYCSIVEQCIIDDLLNISFIVDTAKNNNSDILQRKLKLAVITEEAGIRAEKGDLSLNGIKFLRLAYEQVIDTLPKITSIKGAINFREKNHRSIVNIREAIIGLETELKRGSRRTSINKAINLILSAKKDLNRGQTLEKISEWSTYVSIPLSVVEYVLQLPPSISLVGGLTGLFVTKKSADLKSANKWINFIR